MAAIPAVPLPITALASSSSPSPLLVVASGSSLIVQDSSRTSAIPSASTSTLAADQLIPMVRHIANSADGAYIATASDDKLLRVYSTSGESPTLISTRSTSKKCADISFAPSSGIEPSIIFSDKVGDVYLYPFTPRISTGPRPTPIALQSDPTLNPDADLLLGHVSVLTASVLTPCGKYIITSDRDEHIRVSRFPKSFIIERYLFGSDGFISAMHIPESSSSTLITAGGEQWLRIWDWTTGKALGKVDVYPAVLPHRRARSNLRRIKKPRNNNAKREPEAAAGAAAVPEADMTEGSFYVAPEGYALPSGQGVCIKKIRTISVAEQTFVVFFSEGAAAIHSFPLSLDPAAAPPTISTLPLDFPILDFTLLPSSPSTPPQIVISLDTTWGILKHNPPAGAQNSTLTPSSITPECQAKMAAALVVAEISSDGLSLIPEHPTITSLSSQYITAPGSDVSKLQLYPLLPLLPRWAGMEEDDELAGPAASTAPAASADQTPAEGDIDEKKNYTHEELSQMGNKMLGRLKSRGVDVDEYMKKQTRRPRGGAAAKKRKVGEEGAVVAEEEEVDIEAQMNAA